MLYLIGTGLNDYKDLSLRSLEILEKADRIYLENYTCIQMMNFDELERRLNKKIILADRKMIEESSEIYSTDSSVTTVVLVVGTPLFATTHIDIYLDAKNRGIPVEIIHNTSILNVKGCYGLYSYNFGRTISVPYFTEKWKPLSFYDNFRLNFENGMHTLCLFDIKVDEGRYMSVNEAIDEFLYAESDRGCGVFTPDTEVIAVCRFSTSEEKVYFGRASEVRTVDFGGPLHSMIIPGGLSVVEREFLEKFFNIS